MISTETIAAIDQVFSRLLDGGDEETLLEILATIIYEAGSELPEDDLQTLQSAIDAGLSEIVNRCLGADWENGKTRRRFIHAFRSILLHDEHVRIPTWRFPTWVQNRIVSHVIEALKQDSASYDIGMPVTAVDLVVSIMANYAAIQSKQQKDQLFDLLKPLSDLSEDYMIPILRDFLRTIAVRRNMEIIDEAEGISTQCN